MKKTIRMEPVVLVIFSMHVTIILGSGQFLLPSYNFLPHSRNSKNETFGNILEDEKWSNFLEENESIYNISRDTPQAIFNSTVIRLAAILVYDYAVSYTVTRNGSYTFTGGFAYETMKYIAESYGLDILSFRSDRFASTNPNLNTTDIGTMLVNDECDVAISAHEFNLVRLEKFSYLHPHFEARLWGYFVQPSGSSIRDIYHHVFAFDLWIVLLITWIIVLSVLCGMTYIKQITGTIQDSEHNSSVEIIFWVAGVACQNGYSMNPESTSLKIVFLCALWAGLLVYLSYSAAIVSILAWDMGIKDLSDMVSAKFKFYCNNHSSSPKMQNFLLTLTNKTPEIANEKRIIKLAGKSAFETALVEPKSVFISLDDEFIQMFRRSENLTSVTSDDYCSFGYMCSRITTIVLDRSPVTLAMMVSKNSPWKEFLNIKLLWETNNGILHRLRRTYQNQIAPQCLSEVSYRNEIHLGFEDIFSAVFILLILYAVSLFCFVVEKSLALNDESDNEREEKYTNVNEQQENINSNSDAPDEL